MSIVTWPTGLSVPASFTLGQQRYDMTESSDSTGADAARLLGPPRWTVSLRSVELMPLADAGLWEAMLLQLRGRVNHLAVYDPVRVAPRGTLRGAPTLNATVSAGATSAVLANVRNGVNLLVYSRAFDNAAWVSGNGATVTPNTTDAPLGVLSADTITDASNTLTSYVRETITVPDDTATYTGSLFIYKTSGGTSPTVLVQFLLAGGTGVATSVRINTDTGSIISGGGSIVSYNASWWRVNAQITNNATGNNSLRFEVYPAINAYGLGGTDATVMGSNIVWGAQLERGSVVSAYAGATISIGDWLQIGTGVGTSQLVKVTASSSESNAGTMAVTFEPPLRTGFASGTPVTWDKPVAYYKQTSAPQWGYHARKSTGYALDLLENWTA